MVEVLAAKGARQCDSARNRQTAAEASDSRSLATASHCHISDSGGVEGKGLRRNKNGRGLGRAV